MTLEDDQPTETPAYVATAADVITLIGIYEAHLFGHALEILAGPGATDDGLPDLFVLVIAIGVAERIAELRAFPCFLPYATHH